MHARTGTGTGEDLEEDLMHAEGDSAFFFGGLGEREVLTTILKTQEQNSTTSLLPKRKYENTGNAIISDEDRWNFQLNQTEMCQSRTSLTRDLNYFSFTFEVKQLLCLTR